MEIGKLRCLSFPLTLVERTLTLWVVYAQCLLCACCSVPFMSRCYICSMSCMYVCPCHILLCVSRQISSRLAHPNIIWVMFPAWCNKWWKNFDERSHCMSCCYWQLNDAFAVYVHCSIDPSAFHLAGQPPKLPMSVGGCWPHVICGSLDHVSLRFKRFTHSCTVRPSDHHTDHATCYICSNRPRLMHCMHAKQPKNWSSVPLSQRGSLHSQANCQPVCNYFIFTLNSEFVSRH